MRHKTKRHILGVSGSHRTALLSNLAVALIEHGRIETTLAKAKGLRPFIEKIVTLAKKAEKANDPARKLHYRRLAISRVRDKVAIAKLFDERVTEFVGRDGGYTRIYKIGNRIGDAAEMALIEFIDASDEGYTKPKKGGARKKAAKQAADVDSEESVAPAEVAEANAGEANAEAAESTESAETTEASDEAGTEAKAEEAPKKKAATKKVAKKKAPAKKAAKKAAEEGESDK